MLSKLLECCNHPEKDLKFIHIAGTNGKGSTAIMISKILQEAGYRVGLYTSPYLERFNERICCDGVPIPDDDLAEIITTLKAKIESEDAPVSEFALDTAAAFCWYQKQKPDFVVLETGLGGRLDATNVIPDKLVSVITRVGLDHTQYLGETLSEITREKCGIITHGCPIVTYPMQEDEVFSVIQDTAKEKNSQLYVADIPRRENQGMCIGENFYPLGMQGDFQIYNAATAIKTAEVLSENGVTIPQQAIFDGLKKAYNPARYERLREWIILDGAHNPQAIQSLCDALSHEGKNVYFCVAMMEDKDVAKSAEILTSYAKGVTVTELAIPRCCSVKTLSDTFRKNRFREILTEPNPEQAIIKTWEMATEDDIVCVCGSLYLVGALRKFIQENLM